MKKTDKALDSESRMEQGFYRIIQAGGLSKKQAGMSASRFSENQGRPCAEIVFAPDTAEKQLRRSHTSASSKRADAVVWWENVSLSRRT